MTADEEDRYHVAQANEALDEDGHFVRKNISGRFREETSEFERNKIDFMDVSPKMVFSVATASTAFGYRSTGCRYRYGNESRCRFR